jgi:hypothetical protein
MMSLIHNERTKSHIMQSVWRKRTTSLQQKLLPGVPTCNATKMVETVVSAVSRSGASIS